MKNFLWCICIITFIFSCENEPVFENENNPFQANFYALKVGNYWVYKSQRYDIIEEQYFDNGVIDSVSIVGTEVIQGEIYFKFRTKTTGNDTENIFNNPNGVKFEYFRELDGNLINEEGFIKFTNNNYEERLIKEIDPGNIYEILVEGSTIINVEAGEFNCINSERYLITPDGEQLLGLDRFYYANGFGLIYDTISLIQVPTPSVIRSLVSYSVQ
jgi:hypothetical protein